MCDSGRAGAWGERQVENPPRIGRLRSRLDPCSTPPEVLAAPPGAARHLAESSLLLRGLRREKELGCKRCPAGSPAPEPDFLMSPVLFPYVSDTYLIALWPFVPSPGGLRC
jgi:hypothetical protein